MCDKDFIEANVILCETCSHEVRLCRNPKVGVRKLCKGAPAIVFKSENPSPEFRWWVSKVCKNQQCNKSKKPPVNLTNEEFKSLNPPCCCKQKMKPEIYEGFAYIYKCETCGQIKPLAKLLPTLEQVTG